MLTELIHETRSEESSSPITELEKIAKIKFILVTLAQVAEDKNVEKDYNLQNFVKLTKIFIEMCGSEWPRYFLIKYIFRRYGQTFILNLANERYFNWIIPGYMISQINEVIQ